MEISSTSAADTSGKAFVEHWTWAAEKGLMNPGTAKTVRAACAQILGVLENWETTDIRRLDTADLFRRFQNKRGKDFIPESLETYKRRFTVARASFLEYAADPSSWKPPFHGRARRTAQPEKLRDTPAAPVETLRTTPTSAVPQRALSQDFIDYPFPLRPGRIAQIRLPADLTSAEARRLSAFLASLALDAEPAPPAG